MRVALMRGMSCHCRQVVSRLVAALFGHARHVRMGFACPSTLRRSHGGSVRQVGLGVARASGASVALLVKAGGARLCRTGSGGALLVNAGL